MREKTDECVYLFFCHLGCFGYNGFVLWSAIYRTSLHFHWHFAYYHLLKIVCGFSLKN